MVKIFRLGTAKLEGDCRRDAKRVAERKDDREAFMFLQCQYSETWLRVSSGIYT